MKSFINENGVVFLLYFIPFFFLCKGYTTPIVHHRYTLYYTTYYNYRQRVSYPSKYYIPYI